MKPFRNIFINSQTADIKQACTHPNSLKARNIYNTHALEMTDKVLLSVPSILIFFNVLLVLKAHLLRVILLSRVKGSFFS